ncbi:MULTISPECIES: hypothetical protein [Pseudomonas]|uniref:Uncharacterized protein n=1 Tax=Pseudomonas reactans TaxID=117680 RepID=A0A7Y8KGB1_9PSED|nr:hypothetical protein [Pseudomonas reactans]NWE87943.1 hypothetical protein [Pseudomonas reactans]
MLEPIIRQIAIQAIASRAAGTPTEAALQILKGIAAFDSPGKPFVIWPTSLTAAEQIEALEVELRRIRHARQSMSAWRAMRESNPRVDSGAHPEHQAAQSHLEAFGVPAAEIENQPTPGEAAEEVVLHSEQKPDRGASDVSQ